MEIENTHLMMNHPELVEILAHDIFRSMSKYRHHANISCLDHSLAVAELTFKTAKRRGFDYISATRGALLHDFYLYDWHSSSPGLHGFKHPNISLGNAERYFDLNRVERNAVVRHMWPLTPIPPKYPESLLVCLADKRVTCRDYGRQLLSGCMK